MRSRTGELAIGAIALGSLVGIWQLAPIAQDPAYHAFVDTRTLIGVRNGLNVLTNIGFLLVGVVGLGYCLGCRQLEAPWSWRVFFLGVIAVAFGSAHYHLVPNSETLVWDRLPMAVGFMGLFVALIGEYLNRQAERWLLVPACALGVVSVLYWQHTDDLRLYAWAQFFPLLALLLLPVFGINRYSHRRYLLYGLSCYAAAKVAEFLDAQTFAITGGQLSGHSLKHILATAGVFFVYLMLCRRQRHESENLSYAEQSPAVSS